MSSLREKPLLIFDGDCNFCRRWIARWQSFTRERVDYAPFQEVAAQFPEIPEEKFRASVQLVETTGKIYGGAEAVFRTLAYAPGKRWMLWLYQRVPGVRPFTEWFYGVVARRRLFFSRITRLLWGEHLEPPAYLVSREVFLRFLGLVYLIAFLSFGVQVKGLVGEEGILPAQAFLSAVKEQAGPLGYWLAPTLCWLNAGDFFLEFLSYGGAALSLLLIFSLAPAPVLFLLWLFYLSLSVVGQDFMQFQWDILLLESGFLAIFLAPLKLLPARPKESPPSPVVLWLFWWLLFRLVFGSGVVKLSSGDEAWRSLTALTVHYETQPLPTWIGWYAHQLPAWFQKVSCLGMFVAELAVPFLIFTPRQLRFFGFLGLVGFQILILVTGNYCFFNLLAITLCVLLLDDAAWPGFLRAAVAGQEKREEPSPARTWPKWVIAPLAAVILIVSSVELVQSFRVRFRWPGPVVVLYQAVAPFRSINGYGLFAIMTMTRPEIVIEGSEDGAAWQAYEFKWKPGDLKRRPEFVAPHQPRLDWQMWFAALGDYRNNPWFINLMVRLLQGSPEVLALFEKNPFPEKPPQYLRAALYEYHFTNGETRRAEGTWWRREWKGEYFPVISAKRETGP